MSDDPQTRARLVDNERTKLTCTFLNNLAGSCAFAGIIAPVASVLYTFQVPASHYWGAFVICWLLLALGFHIGARAVLRRLVP